MAGDDLQGQGEAVDPPGDAGDDGEVVVVEFEVGGVVAQSFQQQCDRGRPSDACRVGPVRRAGQRAQQQGAFADQVERHP